MSGTNPGKGLSEAKFDAKRPHELSFNFPRTAPKSGLQEPHSAFGAGSAPPVPPVLSGRDQASPTPFNDNSHPLTYAAPGRNITRRWQLRDCVRHKFSDNKRGAHHDRSAPCST